MNYKQIKRLDGTDKGIIPYEDTPQGLIDHAVAVSAEDDGYHVIMGENLEDDPTREVAHVIASNGVLVWQNVVNPE